MEIRGYREGDRARWLELRESLWPDVERSQLERELDMWLEDPSRHTVLFASDASGRLCGFVELSLREWAEGCESRPVGYLEAWYVDADRRRSGVGRALIRAAERWIRERGATEFASDADIDNSVSHAAHRAVGFDDVGLQVLFARRLDA
jgi:aminoglycoside 6'-N-acetyltransferase I